MLTRTRKPRPRAFIDPFTKTEIKRLVAEFGSPLLIIDCQRVREQYRKLHKALPGVDLHYALKPLPHPAVVQTIVELGGWLDLATTGETQLVTQLGIDPARCIHTHPIKRDSDIRDALRFGVTTFVADNPGVWMDHCHQLKHAADGLVAHLMYEGIDTPYLVGGPAGNSPE